MNTEKQVTMEWKKKEKWRNHMDEATEDVNLKIRSKGRKENRENEGKEKEMMGGKENLDRVGKKRTYIRRMEPEVPNPCSYDLRRKQPCVRSTCTHIFEAKNTGLGDGGSATLDHNTWA